MPISTLTRTIGNMQRQPLVWLTIIAAVPRSVAAIFSEGFYAQDDHFLVIEAAQSWVAGFDYNNWLPWNQLEDKGPTGHMMVYPGLHFLLFKLCAWLGFTDPDGKMILVRLLHAAWSLITVRVGYRIAKRLSTDSIAWNCGLFLALFCYMPFLSVRNLVETVSAPFVMLSAWWLLKALSPDHRSPSMWRTFLIAGLFAGLAMNIRFQTMFFPAGVGLALLLQREWRSALVFGAGVLLPIVVLQGGIDLVLWGVPFAEMTEYVRYNVANPDNTGIVSPWYNYLLLLAGVFIPPLSLAVIFGFLKERKPWVLWLPVVAFVFFHSIFPNKQERFLLPILPLFFVLGYTAWEQWRGGNAWWQQHAGLWRGSLVFVWVLNTLLLFPLTVCSSKFERIDAMRQVRALQDVHGLLIEDTEGGDPFLAPLYYRDVWDQPKDPYGDRTADLKAIVEAGVPEKRANVVLFVGEENMRARLAHVMAVMGPLEYVGCAVPGLLDRTLHWLNPLNRNELVLIFRKRY
jgi:4-amino-4-deoxy-L-arabinose transferase-like glycosyltransferase